MKTGVYVICSQENILIKSVIVGNIADSEIMISAYPNRTGLAATL